jgi:adenine/guanine/hypoxanthine permease
MSSETTAPPKLRLWTRGDLDGFFGLFTNSLANTLAATFVIILALGNEGLVFRSIVPAMVVSLAFGNIYYAWMAWRLGKKEGRGDVTAMPYGLSVPHYFIVTFGIMLPLVARTGDVELAWSIGVAWCFVHAIVVAVLAFFGPFIRKVTPRAAMLGTLAGVAITFIAMNPAFRVFDLAWLGIVCFGIVLFGWLGHAKMPFKLPAGLWAIIVGTALAWVTGHMQVDALRDATSNVAFNAPGLQLGLLWQGLREVGPYLTSAIPLAVYLYLETLLNVESAEVAGDAYQERETALAAAGGTALGAIFGSPVPTLVYIGHPGWKSVGARVGYSWATGTVLLVLGTTGVLALLLALIPIEAIFGILIYIGMVVTAQAFRATPSAHAPAVALALVPWLADWVRTTVDNALGAAGTSAEAVGVDVLAAGGVFYSGMRVLGSSAILVGLILAAIAVFIIDRKFYQVAAYALFAAVASFFGLIHSAEFTFNAAPGPAIGYGLLGVLAVVLARTNPDLEPIDHELIA